MIQFEKVKTRISNICWVAGKIELMEVDYIPTKKIRTIYA
jgi:hypothetical protein